MGLGYPRSLPGWQCIPPWSPVDFLGGKPHHAKPRVWKPPAMPQGFWERAATRWAQSLREFMAKLEFLWKSPVEQKALTLMSDFVKRVWRYFHLFSMFVCVFLLLPFERAALLPTCSLKLTSLRWQWCARIDLDQRQLGKHLNHSSISMNTSAANL